MSRERPILFSAPMVRAILDGRKTVTRRLLKIRGWLLKHETRLDCARPDPGLGDGGYLYVPHRHPDDPVYPVKDWAQERVYCPLGSPGDRLWVKETWSPWADAFTQSYLIDTRDPDASLPCVYRATVGSCTSLDAGGQKKWKPSIFMPREMSRITLEIARVTVERLQDITEEDAKAEGADLECEPNDPDLRYESMSGEDLGAGHGYSAPRSYVCGFANLWDRINVERASWDSNPWVWRIEFSRVAHKEATRAA